MCPSACTHDLQRPPACAVALQHVVTAEGHTAAWWLLRRVVVFPVAGQPVQQRPFEASCEHVCKNGVAHGACSGPVV